MSVSSVAQELLTAAWDALDRKPGRSIIQPGLSVAWDNCCDGQLWVRINGATPVYQGNSNCSVALDVTYAVGIIRCVHSLSDRGKAPTQEQISTDGLDMIDDMCRIYTALDGLKFGHRLTLGAWEPMGPNGGCAGGEWAVAARL